MDNTEVYFGILRALGIDGTKDATHLTHDIDK